MTPEQKSTKAQDEHRKVIEEATKSTAGLDKQLKITTGNDLVHFDAAITQATQSLMQFSMIGVGFGGPGGIGAGAITVGADISDPKAMFREFAETIAAEVQQSIQAEHRRSAVV